MPILKTEEQRKAFMETLMWVSCAENFAPPGFKRHTVRVLNTDTEYRVMEPSGAVWQIQRCTGHRCYIDGIEAKLVKMAAWPYYGGDL